MNIEDLWEQFSIENPNTVGVFMEQYKSFYWLYTKISSQTGSSISLQATSPIKLLEAINAYYEYSFKEHCYKFSLTNLPCLTVTAPTQEEAATKMIAKIQEHIDRKLFEPKNKRGEK